MAQYDLNCVESAVKLQPSIITPINKVTHANQTEINLKLDS